MTVALPNATGYFGVLQWANTQVYGSIGWGILVLIAALVIFGSMRYQAPPSKAFLAASSACLVIGFALVGAGVMIATDLLILLFLVMLAYMYDYHA